MAESRAERNRENHPRKLPAQLQGSDQLRLPGKYQIYWLLGLTILDSLAPKEDEHGTFIKQAMYQGIKTKNIVDIILGQYLARS